MTKVYELPNDHRLVADFDENGIATVTVQALDSLISDLNYYADKVCGIEQIRAEIEQIKPYDLPCDKRMPEHIRDMALDIIDKYAEQEQTDEWQNGYDMAWEEAKVFYEQEPKTGHWEFFCQHWRKCSECGFTHKFAEEWNYCPNCGARMVEPRESEDV